MSDTQVRIGVAGLGRAFTLMLPTFLADPRVRLVAAADPLPAPRARFEADFGAPAYAEVERLCAHPGVELVYLATPHGHHAAQAALAFAHGKHVLVEKPMAISLAEADAMIDAAARAGRHLIVGPSHGYDAPVARVREHLDEGTYGEVRMIHALNYTDFLYRMRRAEELVTAEGGGVVHSQAAHQVDIVRMLGGGLVTNVRAATGAWDPTRATEGAYSALFGFAGGAFASLTYSGYGHFDSDSLVGGTGELGQAKPPDGHGRSRARLATFADIGAEERAKAARNYGGEAFVAPAPPVAHEHFGLVVVSCDRADLRPLPTGVAIDGDREQRFEPLPPPAIPRREVIDEVVGALRQDRAPKRDGPWARATLAACLAILDSARERRDVDPGRQVAWNR